MQGKLGKFEVDKVPFKNYVLWAVVANAVIAAGILLGQKFLPPEVPLFYGLAEGEAQLAPRILLVIPASASIVILILNSFISSLIADEFIKKVIILGAIATALFAVVTSVKITFLVGSF
jgi:hypothetical protein